MLELILGLVGAYLCGEILRYQRHLARLARIPLRIHVNGSRGKSSVTRLIAAGLRAGGYSVLAKTTGTAPRIIFPNGRERTLFRPGKPNIMEQMRIVAQARRLQVDALVIECMGITPEALTVLEDKLIQSQIGVITNVRPDHLETLGPSPSDVARNLGRTIPRNATLFTAASNWFELFQQAASRRGSRVCLVEKGSVTAQEMAPFDYLEHPENLALALAVCQHLGVERQPALRAMWPTAPDPGVTRRWTIHGEGGRIEFYNAFAANDPQSVLRIWRRVAPASLARKIALVVLRPDRPARAGQYADFLARNALFDHCVLAGDPLGPVRRRILRNCSDPRQFTFLQGARAPDILVNIRQLAADSPETVVIGMGNIVGLGEEVAACFQRESESYGSH